MEISINNVTQKKAPPIALWLEEFLFFLKKEKGVKIPSQGEISVAVVGEKKMASFNEIYRKKIGPTDVLSFVYEKDAKHLEGELIFCPNIIEKRGKKNGLALQEEWRRDFVHGMLHLLGMNHGKKMFDLQEKIYEKISQ